MAYSGVPEFFMEIQKGNVYGYSSVNKFGQAIDVDASDPTDLWDGADGGLTPTSTKVWVPPTQARVHALVSSDAADTAAGTGARLVEVQGLDANWEFQTEEVILNGTTPVNTTNSYLRIFRMKVTSVGSGGANAGIIKATAATDATVTAAIQTGVNQTLMAIYTIPADHTGYLYSYYCSVDRSAPSNVSFDVQLLVKPDASQSDAPFQVKHRNGLYINGASYVNQVFQSPLKITEMSDVKLQAIDCTDANTQVSGGFHIVLVNDLVETDQRI